MFKRLIASLVCFTFIFSNIQYVHAQDFRINQLPVPGHMISVTPAYVPLTLKGMVIHPENALKFDFLMDTGHSNLKDNDLSDEALKIMKYFLTALTIPEDDLWVNLSPYEKGRIVQNNFGQTIMGRDLLAEDYVLKQLTASVIYPENSLGKKFWSEIYAKAGQQLGTTQIPVNTFNKVWIVPDQAVVWEHEDKVIIVKSHLKVMLEADYLSASKHQIPGLNNRKEISTADAMARDTVRKLVIPVLEKEVNTGKNFAQLRQMYQAMILATWYKKALRESILNKVYADQKKTKGVDGINASDVESIYQQYLKAFKKGAFNYIKEDLDTTTGQSVPRKYFSGGFSLRNGLFTLATALLVWGATLTNVQAMDVNHALESTGTTIIVKGNITDVGPGASADVVKQFEQNLQPQQTQDAAMFAKISIAAWKLTGNVDKIATMLSFYSGGFYNDNSIHQTARKALDKLLIDSESQLRIGLIGLKSHDQEIRKWAIGMINKSVKQSKDPKTQINVSILGLASGDRLFEEWAIKSLGDSDNKRAVEPLLNFLTKTVAEKNGYIANEISDALLKLGHVEGQFIYKYHSPVTVRGEPPTEHVGGIGGPWYYEGEPQGEEIEVAPGYLEKIDRTTGKVVERIDFAMFGQTPLLVLASSVPDKAMMNELLQWLNDNDHLLSFYLLATVGTVGLVGYVAITYGSQIKVLALRSLPEKLRINALIKMEGNPWAGDALVKIGRPAIPGLLNALKKGSRSAASALGEIGDTTAVPGLLVALKSEDKYLRKDVAHALRSIGWTPQTIDQRILYYQVLENWDELVKVGPPAIPYLIESSWGPSWYDIQRAITKIGLPGVPYLLDALKKRYGRDEQIHEMIASVLKDIGWQPQTLDQSVLYYRWLADWNKLASIGQAAIPALLEALESSEKEIAHISTASYPDQVFWKYNGITGALHSLGHSSGDYIYYVAREIPGTEDILVSPDGSIDGSYIVRGHAAENIWEKRLRDKAMLQTSEITKKPTDLGGIALDAAMLDLQIKRDGNGVPLPVSQQPLDKINIQGFVPQIISIQPVNLPALLGFNFQKEEALAKA